MNRTLRQYYLDSGTDIPEENSYLLEDISWIRTCELKGSDWTQLPDSPLTAEKKQEWASYRTAMRDLPSNLPEDLLDTFFIARPE